MAVRHTVGGSRVMPPPAPCRGPTVHRSAAGYPLTPAILAARLREEAILPSLFLQAP